MQVCHICDVRHCANPGHLFVGTNADNHKDKAEKGRAARGEGNGNAKLTEVQVREIKSRLRSGEHFRRVAEHMGLSTSLVWCIHHRNYWKHVA